MHNIKNIRTNLENFKEKLKLRNSDIDIISFNDLDQKNRNLIQKKETLEKKKKLSQKKMIVLYMRAQKNYLNKSKNFKLSKN